MLSTKKDRDHGGPDWYSRLNQGESKGTRKLSKLCQCTYDEDTDHVRSQDIDRSDITKLKEQCQIVNYDQTPYTLLPD